ncbi:hypothetical protein BHM03_00008729 [Ensete ventricosum]|uniref:Uncharacterized protein n=1 Tax=Ensete ventricosum TaxID=4639 RepID=A0A445MCJ7_ENSVE|nr:hypothetical protein BHM03_00008729 [Ensete ventricosum]
MYYLLRSFVELSCINPKSLTFGYLDKKSADTGLMKFLGLCPSALFWYLEFASAFSTFSAPFAINGLPSLEQGIDDSMKVSPLWYHSATEPMALLFVVLHLPLKQSNSPATLIIPLYDQVPPMGLTVPTTPFKTRGTSLLAASRGTIPIYCESLRDLGVSCCLPIESNVSFVSSSERDLGGCYPSGSSSLMDDKASKALEAILREHDEDSVITESFLPYIRTRYHISDEYALHVSEVGQ